MIVVILHMVMRDMCFGARWDFKDRSIIKHNYIAFHLLWHLKPADHGPSDTIESEKKNSTAQFSSTSLLNI